MIPLGAAICLKSYLMIRFIFIAALWNIVCFKSVKTKPKHYNAEYPEGKMSSKVRKAIVAKYFP